MVDPLSVSAATLSVIGGVVKTSGTVTSFVRTCRDARQSMATVTRQLGELRMVLDLLHDDIEDNDSPDRGLIPGELREQIHTILSNSGVLINRLDKVLVKHSGKSAVAWWVAKGEADVREMSGELDAHARALNIALEVSLLVTVRAVKPEATRAAGQGGQSNSIPVAVAASHNETAELRKITERILDEMAGLKETVSSLAGHSEEIRSALVPAMKSYMASVSDYTATAGDQDAIKQYELHAEPDAWWDRSQLTATPTTASQPLSTSTPGQLQPQKQRPNVANSRKPVSKGPEKSANIPPPKQKVTAAFTPTSEPLEKPNASWDGTVDHYDEYGYYNSERASYDNSSNKTQRNATELSSYTRGGPGDGYGDGIRSAEVVAPPQLADTRKEQTKHPHRIGLLPLQQASLALVESDVWIDGWASPHQLCAVRPPGLPPQHVRGDAIRFRLLPLPGSPFFRSPPPRVPFKYSEESSGGSVYSPDGTLMAWVYGFWNSGCPRGVSITTFPPPNPREDYPMNEKIFCLQFSEDSSFLAVGGKGNLVMLKRKTGSTFAEVAKLQCSSPKKLMFSADGRQLASLVELNNGGVMAQIWGVQSHALVHQFRLLYDADTREPSTDACSMFFWADVWVVACWREQKGIISVYDLNRGTIFQEFEIGIPRPPVSRASMSRSGGMCNRAFAMASSDGRVLAAMIHPKGHGASESIVDVWDVGERRGVCNTGPIRTPIHDVDVSLSPDLQYLALVTKQSPDHYQTQFYKIPSPTRSSTAIFPNAKTVQHSNDKAVITTQKSFTSDADSVQSESEDKRSLQVGQRLAAPWNRLRK